MQTLQQLGYKKQKDKHTYHIPTNEALEPTKPSDPHKTLVIGDHNVSIVYTYNDPSAVDSIYQLANNTVHKLSPQELAAICELMEATPDRTMEDLGYTAFESADAVVYFKPAFRDLVPSGYEEVYTMIIVGPQIEVITECKGQTLPRSFIQLGKAELAALNKLMKGK